MVGIRDHGYDEVPYPDLCYVHSHPSRIAAIAQLYGLNPAPVTACRVLELGCAGGGNLIPMAFGLPESHFVGIDSSARQIDAAKATAAELHLDNIAFHALDVREVGAELGAFDYIIAHGIYSWVPPDVQDKILAICREHLAPEGVAYISYNTLPGWHLSLMIREMMLYHTRNIDEPRERASAALDLIDFLATMAPNAQQSVYAAFLNQYLETRPKQLSSYDVWAEAALLHNELEPVNTPLYFHQFVDQAGKHGLRYLAEAHFAQMMTHDLSNEAAAHLFDMARSTIEREQYLDFLRHQSFRRTLLCRADIDLDRSLRPAPVRAMYISSRARAIKSGSVRPGAVEFHSEDGASYTSDDPLTSAVIQHLTQISPCARPFADLLRDRQASDDAVRDLCVDLLQAYSCSSQLVELLTLPDAFVLDLAESPVASPVARIQARISPIVCNLRHEQVIVEGIACALLPLLDGQHDRAALVAQLAAGDPEQYDRPGLPGEIERALRSLAQNALLIA